MERTYLHDETARPFAHREKRSDRAVADWLYYVDDSSGFAHHLIDDAGAVVRTLSHQAFGKIQSSGDGDVGTPLRFLGQYEDPETGLFYNRFRYYDPDAGRYISPDPQGIARGLNAFRYAENRPNEIADPSGLSGPCTTTVTGTTPDGTPITATGASAGINPDARDRSDSSAWPSPVYNGIQGAQGSKSPVWPAGSCAEPDGVANYLDAAKKSYTGKGQTPPSDEELLKGITKIQTKDKDGPRKPCGHCGKILGSMGLLDKCDPPAGSSKRK
jgi:RHS repeat-associated protein